MDSLTGGVPAYENIRSRLTKGGGTVHSGNSCHVAAIGIAFALYDGRGWCLILSMLATVSAASIAWRAAQYVD